MQRQGSLKERVELARMVMQRLERLSVDSTWARRASGSRGSLVKWLDRYEHKPLEMAGVEQRELLERLIDRGLDLLANAAREIGDPSLISNLPKP